MSESIGDDNGSQPSTSSITLQSSQACRHFKFSDIRSATNEFDESLLLGHGGFGNVYRGIIMDGSVNIIVAIKRLDSSSYQGAPEFWAEVEMLSKFQHRHLVSLLGYCNHEKEMILVYEYMDNGSLEDHLYKLNTPLSWLQRLRICIGAARGLDYLHTGTSTEPGVIHRDVKSSNILLHENWEAKISDFGLSKTGPKDGSTTGVSTLVRGTFGYVDPKYYNTGRLRRKSDVYSFGVVLLEVLCRKHPLDNKFHEGFVTWAKDSIKRGNLKKIIDRDISGQISPKCLKDFVQIAERCLEYNPGRRPTMAMVVLSLEFVLTLQETVDGSLQPADTTKGANSAHVDSKLSSKDKSNGGRVNCCWRNSCFKGKRDP